jgi:hypothetical protein
MRERVGDRRQAADPGRGFRGILQTLERIDRTPVMEPGECWVIVAAINNVRVTPIDLRQTTLKYLRRDPFP